MSPVGSAMRADRPSPWVGCAIASLAALAGLGLRLALGPVLGERAEFLLFIPGVVLSAAYGGLWPGAFATLLGLAGGMLVTAWSGPIAAGDVVSAAVYGLAGGAVVTGGEWFQRARREALAINQDLADR